MLGTRARRVSIARLGAAAALGVASVALACGSDDASLRTPDESFPGRDSGRADAGDPRCQTQAIKITDHPWASLQDSGQGKNVRNVRGFHGRLYFGYGDLNANTGPYHLSSFDPKAKAWTDHLTLLTESVERFVQTGDTLWAPCSDAHGPEHDAGACEAASGNANHEWTVHDFTSSIHVMDVTERVPGEVLLGGSDFFADAGLGYGIGATLWRSVDGGPFETIFPDGLGDVEIAGGPFGSLASLHEVTYAVTGGSVWTWDGKGWLHARTPGFPDDPALLGEFFHPVTIADRIVFAGFGNYLFSFDGRHTQAMNIRLFDTPTMLGFYETPTPIFEAAEGHLLLVNEKGDVMTSTDLTSFECIGKAPADVRGIGALDGTVYFGGADGHIYAYEQPSW